MNVSTSARKASKSNRTQWIAERRLERSDAVGGIVFVRMGCPEWPPGAEEWRCPYVITGLGDDTIHFAHGIETMDTLQNAFRGIRARLDRSGTPVRWHMIEGDHVGFPRYVEDGFGSTFEQRMQRMVLCEVEKLCNEPHDCLADAGLRVAMLEEKHGAHGLVESAKRMLAKARDVNTSASTTNTPKRSRWIASRYLLRVERDDRRIIVRIGRPEMVPQSPVWRCSFEVRGLPDDVKDFGIGVDSIHAIQMALEGIRTALVASGMDLTWEGIRAADPGFPMVIPLGFGCAFEQRLEQTIADKIEERIRPIRERNEQQQARPKTPRKAPKKP